MTAPESLRRKRRGNLWSSIINFFKKLSQDEANDDETPEVFKKIALGKEIQPGGDY